MLAMNQEMDQDVTNDQKRPGSAIPDKESSQLQLAGQDDQEPQPSASLDTTNDVVPTTKLQFLVIFVALILAIFCVALDNTIIVTAIPRITDDFKTLNDVGW